ncbi:MAG: hypothetical protein QM813_07115 [Verrucomicrobiota bacterium]
MASVGSSRPVRAHEFFVIVPLLFGAVGNNPASVNTGGFSVFRMATPEAKVIIVVLALLHSGVVGHRLQSGADASREKAEPILHRRIQGAKDPCSNCSTGAFKRRVVRCLPSIKPVAWSWMPASKAKSDEARKKHVSLKAMEHVKRLDGKLPWRRNR